jgi:hypothetical protein
MMRMTKLLTAFAVLSLFAWTSSEASVSTAGLTFSEETGAFTLLSASGTGSAADPIILTEEVTGLDVTMSIRGLTEAFGNPAATGHLTGFYLRKIVKNLTGQAWDFYDHELQEVLGIASTDGDGLSFADGAGLVFSSDKFSIVDQITDVRDFINFSGGSVADGETVTFNYVITDNSPISPFYLRQRPNFRPGGVIPEPASVVAWSILGLCFFGTSYLTKYWRKAA